MVAFVEEKTATIQIAKIHISKGRWLTKILQNFVTATATYAFVTKK